MKITTMIDGMKTLRSAGCLEAVARPGNFEAARKGGNFISAEDYVGKITSIFFPLIPKNIPDSQFNKIQSDLKKIVVEIKSAGKL